MFEDEWLERCWWIFFGRPYPLCKFPYWNVLEFKPFVLEIILKSLNPIIVFRTHQLSFSVVQMQPLQPFHVLPSEDPQVFLHPSPISRKCPRRATTARLGFLLGFNVCCFPLFSINTCQQVGFHRCMKRTCDL